MVSNKQVYIIITAGPLSREEEESIKQQWQPVMGDDYDIVVCS